MLTEFLEDALLLPTPSRVQRTRERLVEIFQSLAASLVDCGEDDLLLFMLEVSLYVRVLQWLKWLKSRRDGRLVDVLRERVSVDARRGEEVVAAQARRDRKKCVGQR